MKEEQLFVLFGRLESSYKLTSSSLILGQCFMQPTFYYLIASPSDDEYSLWPGNRQSANYYQLNSDASQYMAAGS